MLLFWCVLCVSSLHGVLSQAQLVQPSSEIRKPGESVKMSCKTSGFTFTSYYIHWIQQVPGKGLTWIGRIDPDNGNTRYSSSYEGRFTITTDNSIITAYLQIDRLSTEDSATYYCARSGGSWYFDIWGNGQTVLVTSAEQQAPSLFPLISCGKSLDSTTIIGCLAKDFIPEKIEFTWADKSNNSFTTGLKTYNPVLQSSGRYIASSQVKVTTESWNNLDSYYCTTKHAEKTKTIHVGNLVNDNPSKTVMPVVTMHAPIKDDLKNGNVTIICLASDFYPKDISVKWLKNSKEAILNPVTGEAKEGANGHYTVSSSITVSSSNWNQDNIYSCVVDHFASGFYEMKNLSKSQVCEEQAAPGDIQVTVVRPSFETIFLSKKAILTCVISNIANMDGLVVSWYIWDTENMLETTIDDPVYQDNGYTTNATATVCAEDWDAKKYDCRVKHPDLTSPKKVLLAKENGLGLKVPTVLLYPPHPDELSRKESFTLTCLVKNFSPKDLFVKWQIGGEVQTNYVVTTEAMEEPNFNGEKSYFLYSTLTVKNTESWNNGTPVTCLVGHESLPLQLTQKTIDKTTGKPTSVNVSLVMSDSC